MKRWQLFGIVTVVLAALSLAACSSGSGSASGSASSSGASSNASASSAAPSTASYSATAGAEDVVTISLDYNAGTGFEWQYAADPEDAVSLVNQSTENLATEKTASGGPLQEHFTFRATNPGEVAITFKLERSWEENEPAETQVYAFTVSDDLKMTLNPYKSNFTNEPEWGSNS